MTDMITTTKLATVDVNPAHVTCTLYKADIGLSCFSRLVSNLSGTLFAPQTALATHGSLSTATTKYSNLSVFP